MKKIRLNVSFSTSKMLAIILAVVLFVFAGYVFLSEFFGDKDLQSARIVEVLELEDDQGIVYQNYLVEIDDVAAQKQIKIPLNLPEVRDLGKGDKIYLEKTNLTADEVNYNFASRDKTLEFFSMLVVFGLIIVIILGITPLKNMFPAVVFLVLIASGVFNLSLEVRYIFLSILGFMTIISLVSVLWYFEDMIMAVILCTVVMGTLIFSVLLYSLLLGFTGSNEIVNVADLFSNTSLVYEFAQAKLLVIMILSFGLLINLMLKVVRSAEDYVQKRKNIGRYNLIKHLVEQVQINIGEVLNIIFFLALGLNFTGLVSEDFSRYKLVWNNSFFLGIVVDGMVIASVVLIGGYLISLAVGLYLEYKDQILNRKSS